MKNKHILISGAGIAGLTLAYWLKEYGFSPTVVEKHPSLRTEGYKLDIRGSAVEVCKRMGLAQAIWEARTDLQQARFVDDSGKIIKETSPDLCGVRSEGDLEIVRGKLCEILFNHIGDIKFIFGDSIKSISENANGVMVAFEKNEPQVFDLVIGADGLHSRVRKLCFGEESHFLRELGLYISFYSIPNFLHLDRVEIEYHSSKKFAIVYCPRDGLAKAGFAFSSLKPEFDLRDQNQQREFLQQAFAQAGWEIPRLLSFMKETPDFYFDCMAQIHMPHWTKGRIALVGDAGYAVSPVSGQGNSVALIGAYVLAGELAQAQGDYHKAFQQYEENLRVFVEKNQKLAQMNVTLMEGKNATFFTSIVVEILRSLGKRLPGTVIEFLKNLGLKRTAKAANAIKLKNYEETIDPYIPENIALYEKLYGENLISLGGFDAIENMFSDLNIMGLKALDIGFGLGGVAFYLAKKYQLEVSGVEVRSWMVQYAKDHAPEDIVSLLDFATYNQEGEIPFKNNSFDLIYSKGVLNHVQNKENLFRQINQKLKKNGLFVIADWIYPESTINYSSPLVNETKESYQKILESAGFKNINFRDDSFIFMNYVQKLLENLTINKKFIESTYGTEMFAIILRDHQKLMDDIIHKRKFAMRILARVSVD